MEIGDIVKCVDLSGLSYSDVFLTYGNTYKVIGVDKVSEIEIIDIVDDSGLVVSYPFRLFSKVDTENKSATKHYDESVQPIDLIEAFNLGFNRGNVIKYVSRAGRKDNELEDLEKALWYLEREIDNLKNK